MPQSLQNSQRMPKLNTRNCSLGLVYVKKFTSFPTLSSTKKMNTKENWLLFSASWCTDTENKIELGLLNID